MKKLFRNILCFGVLACVVGCSQYRVYSVKDNPPMRVAGGVLYALPQTQLCVSLTVERRDMSKAPYSAYAADYLGVGPADIDTSFRIVSIDVQGVNIADPNNYYYVQVNRGTVTVDDRHLLLAIGMPNPSDNENNPVSYSPNSQPTSSSKPVGAAYNLYDRVDTFYTRYDKPDRPTMFSTRKDVLTAKQRAAAAAERLGDIQTKQQELIDGEYEGAYGVDAVQYLYAQLEKQEATIIASFCGEVKRETIRFFVDPQMKRNENISDTIIWFSPQMGFVGDEEHLPEDAYPVICNVEVNNDLRSANRFVKYHTSGYTSNGSSGRTGNAAAKYRNRRGFRYRIPAMTTVSVSTRGYAVSCQVPMSQLGPVVELPRHRIKALFDVNTLDLKELDRR